MSPQIHLYRPQRSDPEHLEAIFVARESIDSEILDRLAAWQPGVSRQHYLLIGPRGIGKTCLLQIIQHRTRKDQQLSRLWLPIVVAEEGYGLNTVADLVLSVLKEVAEQTERADALHAWEDLKGDRDDRRVVELALDALRRFHVETGKAILLLLENVNRIFDQQMKNRQQMHLLRRILIEEDWLTVIATSPTFVNAVTEPEEPLFEFFKVILLTELTVEQQEEMLRKLARLEQNREFDGYLQQFRSRLRALYHFTGGNPRLIVMLYDLVVHQRVSDVHQELDALLDQLTPFYQDRMRELPNQERRLLECMALMPEGCTPTTLAAEVRMEPKSVRALLGRLEKSGYVRRGSRWKKQTIYVIPERFFRIWHQMNHSRETRGRVQYLLEFFSHWYASREERDAVWKELFDSFREGQTSGDESRLHDLAAYMQYVAGASPGQEKYEREFEALRLMSDQNGVDAVQAELTVLDRSYRADGAYWSHKGHFLAEHLERHDLALEAFDRAVEFDTDDPYSHYNRAVALDKLSRTDEALSEYQLAASKLTRQLPGETSDRTIPLLLDALRTVRDRKTLRASVHLLVRLGDPSFVKEISRICRDSRASWRRRCCASALGGLGGETALAVLLDLLSDVANEVRGSAATALGHIGDERAVGPLIQCLEDQVSNVRGSAATALGRIGDEHAVEPLIQCLKDQDGINRGSAATALGRIGDERAVDPLIQCLNDKDSYVRGSAATAVGRIGDEGAVEPLIQCLHDQDRITRGSAAKALGRIGDERAVEPLVQCLKDQASNVRASAAMALGRIASVQAIRPLARIASQEALPGYRSILAQVIDQLPRSILDTNVVHDFLRAAFQSADKSVVLETVEVVESAFPNGAVFCAPHRAAIEFLECDRDMRVLERQQPEMREAIQLLIDAYDHGRRQQQRGTTGQRCDHQLVLN